MTYLDVCVPALQRSHTCNRFPHCPAHAAHADSSLQALGVVAERPRGRIVCDMWQRRGCPVGLRQSHHRPSQIGDRGAIRNPFPLAKPLLPLLGSWPRDSHRGEHDVCTSFVYRQEHGEPTGHYLLRLLFGRHGATRSREDFECCDRSRLPAELHGVCLLQQAMSP